MFSVTRTIVKFEHGDYWRALLSDTTPAELPIIINNDGFYLNMKEDKIRSVLGREIVGSFIKATDGSKKYSIPYVFKVVKDIDSARRLSLPHPKAQVDICNFYEKYKGLVVHYCDKGSFSIRRPAKEAGKYYISNPTEDGNKEKGDKVTTLDVDIVSKNPSSFFAYYGINRLHKFFQSRKFSTLEKKYALFGSLDVARCFDSIYTHSVSWATKSLEEAKASTSSKTYGGVFDRLMQSMNYNETNGIVIGPEVSRIFAETILSRIDYDLEIRLKKLNFFKNSEYECFRYVDNYYIFCNKVDVFDTIRAELVECLDKYKMNINPEKTDLIKRPFFTKKSMVIYQADIIIKNLLDSIIRAKVIDKKRYYYADRIYKKAALVRKFTEDVRRACHMSGIGYEACASYILSAIKRRVNNIIDSVEYGTPEEKNERVENCSIFVQFSIEIGFHLFSLHPEMNGSLSLSHILIRGGDFLKQHDSAAYRQLREYVQYWVQQLGGSASFRSVVERNHVTHVEILNILIALKTFDFDGEFYTEVIHSFSAGKNDVNYFDTITKLYIYGNDSKYDVYRKEIFSRGANYIFDNPTLNECSERMHLFVDLVSCPFISVDDRCSMVRKVLDGFNTYQRSLKKGKPLMVPTNAEIYDFVEECQRNPWFACWDGVNLLRLIEKKELKEVYV